MAATTWDISLWPRTASHHEAVERTVLILPTPAVEPSVIGNAAVVTPGEPQEDLVARTLQDKEWTARECPAATSPSDSIVATCSVLCRIIPDTLSPQKLRKALCCVSTGTVRAE